MTQRLRTPAWLLMGLTGSAPGMLALDGGRLSFVGHGSGALTGGQLDEVERSTGRAGLAQRLRSGAAEVVLDVPRNAVGGVKFPWYNFGGGMTLTAYGMSFRFSFLQPQNTRLPTGFDVAAGVADIPGGRAAGKAWRSALA